MYSFWPDADCGPGSKQGCQDATSFPSPTAEMLSGCLGSDPKKGGGRVNGGTWLGSWVGQYWLLIGHWRGL